MLTSSTDTMELTVGIKVMVHNYEAVEDPLNMATSAAGNHSPFIITF